MSKRANGEGSIYRKDTSAGTRWEITVHDENGRRVFRRFPSEKEARATLKEAQRRKDQGRIVLPQRHTMAQLFERWLARLDEQVEREERSLNTWREYESYVRVHMVAALGRIDCRRLTVQDVEGYLTALPLSAKTRSNHRIALRRALNVALKWGWVEQNVAGRTDPIPVQHREVKALSLGDAQKLLDGLKNDVLYGAFLIALYTGLRAGELAGLRVEDIDLDQAVAHVHQQVQPVHGHGLTVKPLKTWASVGRLDLIPEAVAVLADTIGDRTSGYVWKSESGRPYWPTSITHGLKRALLRAGLPTMRLHDLRTTSYPSCRSLTCIPLSLRNWRDMRASGPP